MKHYIHDWKNKRYENKVKLERQAVMNGGQAPLRDSDPAHRRANRGVMGSALEVQKAECVPIWICCNKARLH